MSAEIIPFKDIPLTGIGGVIAVIAAARDATAGAGYAGILDEVRRAAAWFFPQMPDWLVIQLVDDAIAVRWRAERRRRR